MEGGGGDAASTLAPIAKWRNEFARTFQYYLDRSTPHPMQAIYVLRVYFVPGFYIVSYGLGIYILNLLIGFLSPKVDPELELLDGASLPAKESDEFRPFIRRLPEFGSAVFWPILLCYWIVLFVLIMKRQIMHMIKYKYVPFSVGKQALICSI